MRLSSALAKVGLMVALCAFGLTGALSLHAKTEPLYAVLRSVVAFWGVLLVSRWSAGLIDSIPTGNSPPQVSDSVDLSGLPTADNDN